MPPKVGQKAPKLSLVVGRSPEAKPILWDLHEAAQKGPVVVAFFPGAFTSTCTSEMACFTRDWSHYEKLGAQVMGVSVDPYPSLRAWTRSHDYKVPFGSDFGKTAMHEWGLADEFWWGTVTKRATFIVDQDGIVRYADVLPNADLEPNYAEIQAALARIKTESDQ